MAVRVVFILAVATCVCTQGVTEKTKRQIFREQVLPHRGGKIPEDAFRTDRLTLNRLNKDGISVPDGVLLDARRRDKHPALRHNSDLESAIVKLVVTPDGRYTAPEGRPHHHQPTTVDSTYIIRQPIGQYSLPSRRPYRPIPVPLHIPTHVAPKPPLAAQVKNTPAPPPVYFSFPDEDSSNFLLQSHNAIYSEPVNPFYSHQAYADFESFFRHLNERAARHAEAIRLNNYRNLPGNEGVDYPVLQHIPPTGFTCKRHLGHHMRADPETRCQVFHICQQDGRRDSFLCPKGTLFSETISQCDWWYNVKCG